MMNFGLFDICSSVDTFAVATSGTDLQSKSLLHFRNVSASQPNQSAL